MYNNGVISLNNALFSIIMGAFCIIVCVQDVLIGSIAIEAKHF